MFQRRARDKDFIYAKIIVCLLRHSASGEIELCAEQDLEGDITLPELTLYYENTIEESVRSWLESNICKSYSSKIYPITEKIFGCDKEKNSSTIYIFYKIDMAKVIGLQEKVRWIKSSDVIDGVIDNKFEKASHKLAVENFFS